MLLANLAFISLRVLHRIHIQFAVLQRFETLSAQALSMGFPRGWPLESMCYVQALRMLMRNLVLALPPAALCGIGAGLTSKSMCYVQALCLH